MEIRSLLGKPPQGSAQEHFEMLLENESLCIERIVSLGHTSPDGFWYDQERSEWVLLIQGEAHLEFEGQSDFAELKPGEYLNIPAHCKHRVVWTDPEEYTIWLTIYY